MSHNNESEPQKEEFFEKDDFNFDLKKKHEKKHRRANSFNELQVETSLNNQFKTQE